MKCRISTIDGDDISVLEAFVRVAETLRSKREITEDEIARETGLHKNDVKMCLILIKTLQDTVPNIHFQGDRIITGA